MVTGSFGLAITCGSSSQFTLQILVRSKASHSRYREAVRRVLNSGSTLRKYRVALDEEARMNQIDKDRQSRIETAMLFPLNIVHFMLVHCCYIISSDIVHCISVGLIIYPVISFLNLF